MINIVFGDCIFGSLKMADYYAKENNSDITDLKENLFNVNLFLNQGDISGDCLGDERYNFLSTIYDGYDYTEWYCQVFVEVNHKISRIRQLLEKGEKIRIWYSNDSMEICSFCWIISLLDYWGIENDRIFCVHLPELYINREGKYQKYPNSGFFEPLELAELVHTQEKLTESKKWYYMCQWKSAKDENSALRVYINGDIVSVGADFFDNIILSLAQKFSGEFREIELIGNVLGRINISIVFLAWRIEKMIEQDLFEVVEEAKEDKPYYKIIKRKNFN